MSEETKQDRKADLIADYASVGEENFVYWECPECEKESIKINNLIIELSNLSSGSMSTIKRELKILIEDYGYRKMVSGCINVKEGE